MKKNLIFLIFVLINFNLIASAQLTGKVVTGEAITGEATSSEFGIGISVVIIYPTINILSPKNQTYLTNESLLLNYSSNNANQIWYNLDNSENITITSQISFNASQGAHTLFIYANNSKGLATDNITFIANSTKFIILYEKYDGKENSINFLEYSYEEIQELIGIILENENGKLLFNEYINITDDLINTDNLLDLDTNTNISFNEIKLNSTALPNFNKSTTIWLYNLNFSNPRILRENQVCPSQICVIESYSGGTLKFNVTGFTTYSAEETPLETPPETPSTQGGGTTITESKFITDTEKITISLKQGETKYRELKITNNGDSKLSFAISGKEINQFIKINETTFDLNPEEQKIIRIDFIASEDAIPELYIGQLIIQADSLIKEIYLAIEIESKEALFDIKTEIPEKFKYILPGEEIVTKTTLYNLGSEKRVDVVLDYIIKSIKGEEIISQHETIAVETQASIIKTFKIPEKTKYGDYIFYVRVNYDDKIASASAEFSVVSKKPIFTKQERVFLLLFLILILLILIDKTLKKKKKIKKRN